MTVGDFVSKGQQLFDPQRWGRMDSSMNGLQVGRLDKPLKHLATAVDACYESFRRAHELGADVLMVHHGLFWGKPLAITGEHLRRVQFLLDNDISLYAMHLPLDEHPEIGNNAVIARELGLLNVRPFGRYKGVEIGVQGELPAAVGLDELVQRLFGGREQVLRVLPFGADRVKTVGVISGGAPRELEQAVAAGLDVYITGDASHEVYHMAQEAGINVVFGGHYATETWGVRSAGELIARELGIEHTFVDVPTGL